MPLLSGDDVAVSSTLVDLLKGDALNRALAASQLGWSPALEAAPGIWRAPFLIYALGDSYAAVRLLAYQSLRRVPGFEAIEYDYLADDETRQRQIAEARNRWSEVASGAIDGLDHSIPLTLQGWPNPRVIERLLTQQDRRGVHIVE